MVERSVSTFLLILICLIRIIADDEAFLCTIAVRVRMSAFVNGFGNGNGNGAGGYRIIS